MSDGQDSMSGSGESALADGHPWESFVALGDSFTEGLDDTGHDGRFRGWADRLAEHLAASKPELHFANLAVRGKLLDQVIAEQLPAAAELRPSLISLAAGGNDILRPFSDPDHLADRFDGAVARLRATGADVLIATGFDTRSTPIMRLIRGKVGTYNAHLRAIADRHGCYVSDIWSMPVMRDRRAWSVDRLHLSAEGHRRVALRAAETLGLAVDGDWRSPLPTQEQSPWRTQRVEDLQWARDYLKPWIGRRLRGESSGDGRQPKRPELQRL